MGTIEGILKVMTAGLFLLCMLVPQHAAAPNFRSARGSVGFQESADTALVWSKLVLYKPPGGEATFFESRDVALRAVELPTWESIVAFANNALKLANETLDAVAREFNVTGEINNLYGTFDHMLTASVEIRGHMNEITQHGLTLDQISDDLEIVSNDIVDYLRETFPPPDRAPNHEERQKMVTCLLDKGEQGFLELARNFGMSDNGLESLRKSFDKLEPHIEKLVVVTGDLVEQHPILFDALTSSVVAMVIPESWILRPFLSAMGFGLSGPAKGSPAAWAQRQFWGPAVKKGSWFAILQKVGMKGASGVRPILGAIGGAIGALFGKISH